MCDLDLCLLYRYQVLYFGYIYVRALYQIVLYVVPVVYFLCITLVFIRGVE